LELELDLELEPELAIALDSTELDETILELDRQMELPIELDLELKLEDGGFSLGRASGWLCTGARLRGEVDLDLGWAGVFRGETDRAEEACPAVLRGDVRLSVWSTGTGEVDLDIDDAACS
jgi:hypothetical protein